MKDRKKQGFGDVGVSIFVADAVFGCICMYLLTANLDDFDPT